MDWSNCSAGMQESVPPTVSTDRICVSCVISLSFIALDYYVVIIDIRASDETFKAESGQSTDCIPVNDCDVGFGESVAPTLTSDRICTFEKCPLYVVSVGFNLPIQYLRIKFLPRSEQQQRDLRTKDYV